MEYRLKQELIALTEHCRTLAAFLQQGADLTAQEVSAHGRNLEMLVKRADEIIESTKRTPAGA